MPLSSSAVAEKLSWLNTSKMQTNHCKIYQLTVQSRQMLVNIDGVLQMGILQLVADGVLWREHIVSGITIMLNMFIS